MTDNPEDMDRAHVDKVHHVNVIHYDLNEIEEKADEILDAVENGRNIILVPDTAVPDDGSVLGALLDPVYLELPEDLEQSAFSKGNVWPSHDGSDE